MRGTLLNFACRAFIERERMSLGHSRLLSVFATTKARPSNQNPPNALGAVKESPGILLSSLLDSVGTCVTSNCETLSYCHRRRHVVATNLPVRDVNSLRKDETTRGRMSVRHDGMSLGPVDVDTGRVGPTQCSCSRIVRTDSRVLFESSIIWSIRKVRAMLWAKAQKSHSASRSLGQNATLKLKYDVVIRKRFLLGT